MKKIITLLLLVSISSCATKNIKYSRNKILEKYNNYKVFLDDEKIDFKIIYLFKDNIKTIKIDKVNKEMNISQFKTPTFLELKDFSINNKEVALIVIDGVPVLNDLIDKIRIEHRVIKSIEILKEETTVNFCRRYNGEVILITTK